MRDLFPQRPLSVFAGIATPTRTRLTNMFRRLIAFATLAAACAHQTPQPELVVVTQASENVRVAPAEQPVAPGDCAEALRRAAAKPDLVVDRIPSHVVAKPAALQKPPRTALNKDGSAEIKVDILIDTLGRADLRTFTVVKSSNRWLTDNVKSVIG